MHEILTLQRQLKGMAQSAVRNPGLSSTARYVASLLREVDLSDTTSTRQLQARIAGQCTHSPSHATPSQAWLDLAFGLTELLLRAQDGADPRQLAAVHQGLQHHYADRILAGTVAGAGLPPNEPAGGAGDGMPAAQDGESHPAGDELLMRSRAERDKARDLQDQARAATARAQSLRLHSGRVPSASRSAREACADE